MEPQHVRVETLDAEVLCPYCKQTARKEGPPPGRPWPEPWDETIKDATDLIAIGVRPVNWRVISLVVPVKQSAL